MSGLGSRVPSDSIALLHQVSTVHTGRTTRLPGQDLCPCPSQLTALQAPPRPGSVAVDVSTCPALTVDLSSGGIGLPGYSLGKLVEALPMPWEPGSAEDVPVNRWVGHHADRAAGCRMKHLRALALGAWLPGLWPRTHPAVIWQGPPGGRRPLGSMEGGGGQKRQGGLIVPQVVSER